VEFVVSEHVQQLLAFERAHAFFVGIDSDGCVFDTMELKHKECFIPNIIRYFGLQSVSRFAREAAEFVNLYSASRGVNRFPALVMVLDLLRARPEVSERAVQIPEYASIREWLASTQRPGNPALAEAITSADEPERKELEHLLDWSQAVNQSIEDMVSSVAPFPHVRECLDSMQGKSDLLVVSATPCEALEREWAEHGLDSYPQLICGQEMGTKAEHLAVAAERGYEPQRMLMIGDAPGDLRAARTVSACFYPINPGDESRSWERLHDEALPRFFAGDYAGAYEAVLITEFEKLLPECPPWEQGA
jgi:phosphoglycolate phosphatase-like HAD superfamily hydrolase